MPTSKWNSFFLKIKEALYLNNNHNQIGHVLSKSKCDLANGFNCYQYDNKQIKIEDIKAAQFRAKYVNNDTTVLYSNFNRLCIDNNYFEKDQGDFLKKVIDCHNKLLQHYLMVWQDPNNFNVLVYLVCTSKPNKVGIFSDVFILKTINVIRIGSLNYYLSSEEYKYNLKLDETFLKNNILVPLSEEDTLKFMKGDLDMLFKYVNQTKIILDSRLPYIIHSNSKNLSIDVNTYVSKVFYNTGELNKKAYKWDPLKWEHFKGDHDILYNKIKVLLKQADISIGDNE